MIIKSMKLKDFRNYESLKIQFDSDTNIIYGDNAQGKTNMLEALYLSGTTKSHKGSHEKEMIRFGENEAHICTVVENDGREFQIDFHLKKNHSKGVAINRIPIKKASELFGILNIIFFSPEDLNIIKNGPDRRRRFIDSELCQIDKIYLYNLTNYKNALQQRNKLLKDIYFNPSLKELLPDWDDKLVEFGKKIIERRREFLQEIAPTVTELHRQISGGKEIAKLSYEPNIEDMFFADELVNCRERDLKQQQTNVGPHRDDIRFEIDGIDIRKFGSQGQQRTCALSLKLSEISVIESATGERPVLLLDDVMSELDSNRQNYLLGSLKDTQTIITCTGLDDFVRNRFPINKVFEVVAGSVYERDEHGAIVK
ncbi:DNA replication and repair protein RecF [Lachnospiraceae bacterium KHCPX20]|nr:DNA replication and repair protein RecF [Lachnospiraceae bacterium KHCPX20]